MKQIQFILFVLVMVILANCTKVVATASTHTTEPVVRDFKQDAAQLYHQSVLVLQSLGYEVVSSDPYAYELVTGWKKTTAGSHYLELFNRQDYSASTGSYYQIVMNVKSTVQGGAQVEMKTRVKSLSGKLSSSEKLEKNIFNQLAHRVRSENIQITNVGIQE